MCGERERERERERMRERGVNNKFINMRSFSVLQGSAENQFGHGPCTTHPGGRRRPYSKKQMDEQKWGEFFQKNEIRIIDTRVDIENNLLFKFLCC